MGVPSLNDLAVDGMLNTTNQPFRLIAVKTGYDGKWHIKFEGQTFLPCLDGLVAILFASHVVDLGRVIQNIILIMVQTVSLLGMQALV